MSDSVVDILIVDDNVNDVELALHALNAQPAQRRIRVARDGIEALDLLLGARPAHAATDYTPNVVLLDIKLPKMDGLEVLRRLKADPRTHTIPIVMLTSSREDRDIRDSYRLGVNSYVVKPVDFDEFTQAVQQVEHYWLNLNQPPAS
jgi:two-component system, response regulator